MINISDDNNPRADRACSNIGQESTDTEIMQPLIFRIFFPIISYFIDRYITNSGCQVRLDNKCGAKPSVIHVTKSPGYKLFGSA